MAQPMPSGALQEFKLPDVGEGLTEAEIVKWHVAVGDTVEANQTIVEIETAKAIVELPCPFEGVVAALLVEEGVTAAVGTPIIRVAPAGSPLPPAEPTTAPTAEQPKHQPVLVGYGVKKGATHRRTRKTTARPRPVDDTPKAPLQSPARASVSVLAKPPVRKLAKDLGVDLRKLVGTGPAGSITRDDVQAAAHPAAVASPGVAPAFAEAMTGAAGEVRIPIRGVRKATAAAMVRSAFTAPHVTEFLQIDVTETMEAVRRLRELPDFAETAGVRVSPLLLVAKAVLVATARHPMVNSAWDEAAQEIVVKHHVNLGIAAATERGLIVPNIKSAHALALPALARALTELAETARAGRARPADLTGGTLTITNIGVFGVDAGTPILTSGESAILAFGQVREMPWVHEAEIKIRKVATLALSFDHRVVDGELGSHFLRDIGAMLEDPLRMLAWN